MIKLIASDLDGTVLQNGAQEIEPEFFQLILDLKKKGIHFVAASGREYDNMRNLFDPIKDEISYVSLNGAQYHYNGKRTILSTIEPELTQKIIRAIRAHGRCEIIYSSKYHTYVESKNDDFKNHLTNIVKNNITVVDDLLALDEPALKIAICDPESIDNCESYFREIFEEYIGVRTSGNLWLDFIPLGVDKSIALQYIMNHRGVTPDECMAFGDQWNDVEMLEMMGTSFAMANAVPGISAYSTNVTDSVEKELRKLLD
ncbi:MAG: HAD family hydrolase [Lachnospiraceae bacterium]|nr:HAD family hydrolase [Lachnospiraceae bacterium]